MRNAYEGAEIVSWQGKTIGDWKLFLFAVSRRTSWSSHTDL